MNTLYLDIGATDTTAVLSLPDGGESRWHLPIGWAVLWPGPVGPSGPSALAIEQAIQTVEDQVERLAGHIPAGARLVVAAGAMAPLQRAGAIWGLAHEAIARAQIEREYQQLAARSVGAPSAKGSGFDDPAGDALVLILRECLHHLGFDAVHLTAA
ncbi:MAG: hypothetical protein IV088_16290 [Hydrogenophaga sp.]|uniref:hypothetical protein n=1 Tax=Hydrogenophaga sp. TaxID=1904254 RepID=UPI0025C6B4E9|nr:hypothetical protein [Hydrogenophaga sp.]MBT9552411.1 hypothetical protein [Hydrogenophaga sp.]